MVAFAERKEDMGLKMFLFDVLLILLAEVVGDQNGLFVHCTGLGIFLFIGVVFTEKEISSFDIGVDADAELIKKKTFFALVDDVFETLVGLFTVMTFFIEGGEVDHD